VQTYISIFKLFSLIYEISLFRELKSIMITMLICVKAVAVPGSLLAFILFFYTVAGVQLFAGEWTFSGLIPRTNYNSFYFGFLSSFVVMTGENWNVLLYFGVRSSGFWGVVFFVTMYILGRYIILSSFLAVISNAFAENNPIVYNRKLAVMEQMDDDKHHVAIKKSKRNVLSKLDEAKVQFQKDEIQTNRTSIEIERRGSVVPKFMETLNSNSTFRRNSIEKFFTASGNTTPRSRSSSVSELEEGDKKTCWNSNYCFGAFKRR